MVASSAATLGVFTFLVIVFSAGHPATATTACQDCASSCSSVDYAAPTGPCSGECSPDPVCVQNCKPGEIAKCESGCTGSCNTGCKGSTSSCDCSGKCSKLCAGAGGVCNSRCTNSTACQACKDKYAQQCTATCNANCV